MPPLRKGGMRRSRRGDRRGRGVSLFRATGYVRVARVRLTRIVLRRQTHGPATSTPPVSAQPRLSSPYAGEALGEIFATPKFDGKSGGIR